MELTNKTTMSSLELAQVTGKARVFYFSTFINQNLFNHGV